MRLKLLSDLNIRQKLTLALLPVVLAFLLTNTYIFLSMNSSLKSSIVAGNHNTVIKMRNEITTSLRNLDEESTRLLMNADVREYLEFQGPEEEEALVKSRFLRVFNQNNTITGTMVRSTYVIKSPTNFAYYSSSWGMDTGEIREFAQWLAATGAGLREIRYQNPEPRYFGQCGVLHCIYPLQNPQSWENTLLVVNLSPSFLANICARYYFSDAVFYITDRSGNLIYRMSDDPYQEIVEAYGGTNRSAGVYYSGRGDERMLTVREPVEELGWTISIQVPERTAFFQLSTYREIFVVTSVLSILMSLFLIRFASKSVAGRVQELNGVMTKVREGDLSARFPVKYRDELSVMGNELNHMIDSIQYLRFDITEREMRQREAELSALQNQINPHFLYNTLETIRMIAIGNGDPQTGDIIKTLSDLLRYTIRGGEQQVTLRQELEQVQSYLKIQKLRFGDRFRVELDVEERALSCMVLKLTLQPLVENAFSHGIKSIEADGVISISARREDGCLRLQVRDNGQGISGERLEELRRILGQPPFQTRGKPMIGLPNVGNRIKLYYGERYGLKVDSEEGRGTCVTVLLPLLEGGNEAEK